MRSVPDEGNQEPLEVADAADLPPEPAGRSGKLIKGALYVIQ